MNELVMSADTSAEPLTAGAAAVGGALLVFMLIFFILLIVASWKIFTKAGIAGWKSLIPIYNVYLLFKLSGMKNWFWITIVASIVCGIVWGLFGLDPNLTPEQLENIDLNKHMPAVIAALVLALINCIAEIMLAIKLAKVFGKGTGFAVGLILLPNIFQLILGFGSAKYDKKALKA